MKRIIIYIGMDVHKESYSLCAYNKETDILSDEIKINASIKELLNYLSCISDKYSLAKVKFICGYEAGGLGYSLYKDLISSNIECKIMAPTTMAVNLNKIKTDRRDARNIAKNLAFKTYKEVVVPSKNDEEIKN